MSLFMAFLIGFCIGGVVGCDSPKTNTNTILDNFKNSSSADEVEDD